MGHCGFSGTVAVYAVSQDARLEATGDDVMEALLSSMTAQRDALKELFFAALERPLADREAFLASAEADPEVLREVHALLASHEQAKSFLESGLPAGLLPTPTLSAGQRLGPYEVAELIGEGGMGEVYRASDTRLGRQVAIKVLPTLSVKTRHGSSGSRTRHGRRARSIIRTF